MTTPSKALQDIAAERARQVSVEGWTPEHDDNYRSGELEKAAAAYCLHEAIGGVSVPWFWPWAFAWWKPSDHRRNLVKAGALIAAAIERIDRAARPKE